MRTIFSVLLLLILSSTTIAQQTVYDARSVDRSDEQQAANHDEEPPVRHISHLLRQTPEAREALEQFRRMKALPRGLAAKVPGPRAVGDTAQFDVYNVDEETWMRGISFVLKAVGPAIYLWVEQAELDSNYVRNQDVDSLYSALQERTPGGSFDPDEGIIVNNNEVFGSPSDIDENGRVHVLLTDIKDGREESPDAPFVAGFFHPSDLGSGPGNQAEILYLDTRPGIYTDNGEYRLSLDLQATAAHEYQHLIHANYDVNEEAFVNEGLSEWAEIVNGYPRRPAEYLSNASDSTGYNVDLFLWRRNSDDVLYDYQRAGLLTHYLAEQIGVMETGALTRSTRQGTGGYSQVLPERNFEEFLLDFHTANSLNNAAYDPAYGYVDPGRSGLHAAPAFSYDGRTDQRTSQTTATVSSGAVQYLQWDHVEDLRVTIDAEAVNSSPADLRQRFRIRAVAERSDGTISVRTFTPRATETFDGSFDRITLIAAHIKLREREAPVAFSATWNQRETSFARVTRSYDDGAPFTHGENDDPVLFTMPSGRNGAMATRFAVPDSDAAVLSNVSLAFYFFSQFQNGPPQDAPRDFTLYVWDNGPLRRPGEKIFSVTMDDPRSYRLGVPRSSYDRFTVDLADYEEQLSNLPDTIFVGVGEAGTDDNYIVIAPAPYDSSNTSFIGNVQTNTWQSLWQTELTNSDVSLDETTLPTRVEFLVPDTTERMTTDTLMLASNYPNPFNTSTQIEFSLPEEGPVLLRVYDILGRHITTLVDETMPANRRHLVSFDGSSWPSGVYFYVLQYGEEHLSRKMMLVK